MRPAVRRILLGTAVVLLVLLISLAVAVTLSPVQRWLLERAVAAVSAATGVELEAQGVELRLLPARLALQDLRVSLQGRQVASVDSLEASWSWLQLISKPRRIRKIALSGVEVDLRRLPATGAAEAGGGVPQSMWTSFEIGSLDISGGHVIAAPDDTLVRLTNLRADASLKAGVAQVRATADGLVVRRQARDLGFGEVTLEAAADASGLRISKLAVEGPDGGFQLSGRSALSTDGAFDLDLQAHARLEPVLSWWDPALAAKLQPSGAVALRGRAQRTSEGAPEAHLEQVGTPFELAGYQVGALDLDLAGSELTVHAAGDNWGRATVTVASAAEVTVDATLQEAPLGPVLTLALGAQARRVPGPVLASGTVEGHLSYPVRVEDLSGQVDVRVTSPRGSFAVQASGAGRRWQVQRLLASAPGAELQASGDLGEDGKVSAHGAVDVQEPARLVAFLSEWWPPLNQVTVAGGPLTGQVEAAGSLAAPRLDLTLGWLRPAVMGLSAQRLEASGRMEEGGFAWQAQADLGAGAVARVEGTTGLASLTTEGRWRLAAPSLAKLAQERPLPADVAVTGSGEGEGAFSWSPESWRAQGELALAGLDVAGWQASSAHLVFSATPAGIDLSEVEVQALGGSLHGSGSIGLAGFQSTVTARLEWQGVEVAKLPIARAPELSGVLAGSLSLGGTLARPQGVLQVRWQDRQQASVADEGEATLALADGVLRLTTDRVQTVGGSFIVQGSAPLGDLPLPSWLWPEAPGGPVRLALRASDVRSQPLLEAVGVEFAGAKVAADAADVDLRWDATRPEARQAQVMVRGLSLETTAETVRATGPLLLEVDGSRVLLEPLQLEGPRTQIAVQGAYDLSSDTVDAAVDATLGPDVARLLPIPVRVLKPVHVALSLSGPLLKPTGRLVLDHSGGELVMRDPPLEVRDLHLVATVEDGIVAIDEGSATVNRGQMLIGGGWNPSVGQGIVLELTDVYFLLPMNIITSWSGQVALEPDPQRLVKVVGDVYLQAGVWDHPVNITSLLLQASTPIAAPLDDPLRDVLLDLQVWGRGQIRVDNNLGDFTVTWSLLHVGGTAAVPQLRGVLRLSPGGTLNMPGQAVNIRRAEIDFTGVPGAAPNIQIVPQQNIASFAAGQSTTSFNAAELATQTMARGIGSALGLENETLQPAEIGVETETNAASNFTIGQRLGRNVALFFSSDLGNVQDQTTMLQLWNFPALPGLALQGYSNTQQNGDGFNLIERFRWGGSLGAGHQSTIQAIHLEGRWPISKRRLKKATGMRKGEPYEPFLLFAAGLAMERELAGAGYQEALVDGRAEGNESLPTLVFTVEPGPLQAVRFEGAMPPKDVRRDVTSLYQPPPLEEAAFDNMAGTLERYYAAEDHPEAKASVARQGEEVVATIDRGPEISLEGPIMEGVPGDVQGPLGDLFGNPAELANLLRHPDAGKRVVERVLQVHGYSDGRVVKVWAEDVDPHLRRVHLDVAVGPQEKVGRISLAGEDPLRVMADRAQLGLEPGMPLDRARIELAASRIRSRYVEAGYTDAQVQMRQEKMADDTWNLTVELDPGRRRTISEISIEGLRHISRSVIRKGLVIDEGEVYQPSELDKSVARIASFAPVDSVEATTHPLGEDRTKVDLVVREKPRWTVEAGAGWNSDRGSELRLGLRDDDLFGRGVGLNLRGRVSQSEQLVYLYGSLPPPPGGRISFLGNLSYFDGPAPGTEASRHERRYGVAVEGDYQLGVRGTSARAYYQLSRTTTTYEPFTGFLLTETFRQAILGAQVIQDELDNPFDPRRGYYAALDLSWNAQPLGSQTPDLRSVFTGSWAVSPWPDWTWAQALRLGWASGLNGYELTQDRAFFAGGQASIRGFDLDAVGPTTFGAGGTLVAAGGSALFILNNELRIPVWDGLRVAVFADVGQVWTDWGQAGLPFAVGTGFGLRWSTPVGPLWADVAWPVADVGISSRGPKFYLGIGRPF